MIALGICLGVAGAILMFVATYFVLRQRRRNAYGRRVSIARPVSDLRHPANTIAPFGIHVAEGPRFANAYMPGTNMRVACQRPDGSWQFSHPEEPFAPACLSDIDLEAQWRKDRETKKQQAALSHSRAGSRDDIAVPPPAYTEVDYPTRKL